MRLITNEELLVVAGGEYLPIWQAEEIEAMQWALEPFEFDMMSFGNSKGAAKKTITEPKTQAEAEETLKILISSIKAAIPDVEIDGKLSIEGQGSQVGKWKMEITIKASNKD